MKNLIQHSIYLLLISTTLYTWPIHAQKMTDSGKPVIGQTFRDKLRDGSDGPLMVRLPAGQFHMGDIQGKGEGDEKPLHQVSVDRFAIGVYEVTRKEFGRFVKATDYVTSAERWGGCTAWVGDYFERVKTFNWRTPGFKQSEEHPVVCVSHRDVLKYLLWLNRQTKQRYRLPTEAQWEYAVRAGTNTTYWWGNGFVENKENCDEYAEQTVPVGTFKPNQFGLYDTLGNAWEWVSDWYGDYSAEVQSNPKGGPPSEAKVIRGGGWALYSDTCRSANRGYGGIDNNRYDLGFRVVRLLRR
ncbi:MAG: formylglycine-generating enzyme family protein [Pseudomonadota bacterium]